MEDKLLETERIVTKGEIMMDLLEQKMSDIPTDLPRAVESTNEEAGEEGTKETTQGATDAGANNSASVPPPPSGGVSIRHFMSALMSYKQGFSNFLKAFRLFQEFFIWGHF